MKYNIYAIQDVLIGFNSPIIFKNEEIAKREYNNFLETNPNRNDMRLFKIGEFDDETGEIKSDTPRIVEGD